MSSYEILEKVDRINPSASACSSAATAAFTLSQTVSVLFARQDSIYKQLVADVWDIERDALNWPGGNPVVAHPPCRAWGVLKHMAKPRHGEKDLAVWAVEQVRRWGGVLEHPVGSELWDRYCLGGWIPDRFGGWCLEVDQHDFGHVANKPTRLYIVGCAPQDIPVMPPMLRRRAEKSITGQVPGTKRCTQYEREYTPPEFAAWLVDLAGRCRPNERA